MSLTVVDQLEVARRPDTTTILPFNEYDVIIVSFSGGRDSIALVLALLEAGVSPEKIQLWHQKIDDGEHFMDWPCTEGYCRAFAKAMGLPIFFQWRHGGFKRELLKHNDRLAPISFERQDRTIGTAGGVRGKISTRRLFPQVSADLSKRWCSSVLKIDTMACAVSNEPTFKTAKILVLTGERREESKARSLYAEKEQHRCNTKSRRVDHYRMVIDWTEEQVWAIMKRHGVIPHPCYRLGFSRCSCMKCIFIGPDEWATNARIDPTGTSVVIGLERDFGKTIKRQTSVAEMIARGTVLPKAYDENLVRLAMSREYPSDQILLPPGVAWELPPGAFKGGGCGPI